VAIYRPPKARWPLAAFGALVGVGAGVVIGLLLAGDPDPRDAALDAKAELSAAAGSLEVAAIEYDESVDNGEIVNENEYRGAQSALDSSRSRFAGARGVLDVLAPELADSLAADYDQVAELMQEVAEPAEVQAALDELAAQLRIGSS
jgi:hypothetical protein